MVSEVLHGWHATEKMPTMPPSQPNNNIQAMY